MEFLKNLNWVDIVLILLVVRIIYSGGKAGFVVEFIKTIGLFFAMLMAFHFFARLAALGIHFVLIPKPWLQAAAFILIWLTGVIVFKLIREGFLLAFTIQPLPLIDRWGAVLLAVVRSMLTASMVLFVFLMTAHPYLQNMTRTSLSHKYVINIAPKAYHQVTLGFIAAVMPGVRVNPVVGEVLTKAPKK
ncbi:MAG: CvpA family protein [Candidatus Omnitrophota bacterium]